MAGGVNIIRYSGQLDQGVWAKNNVAVANIAGGSISAPNGTVYRVINTGTNPPDGRQYLLQGGIPEFQPNTKYTLNIWVKNESDANQFVLSLIATTSNGTVSEGCNSIFTIGDTSVTANASGGPNPFSSITGGVIPLADGWFQVWLQATTGPQANGNFTVAFVQTTATATGASWLFGGMALYQGNEFDYAATTTAPRGNLFLPTFTFPYHRVETRYPQQGGALSFGAGYQFTSQPKGPPQRIFVLNFPGMQWQVSADGTVDQYTQANNNPAALETFYQLVGTWNNFNYPHMYLGNLVCKFNKSLQIPAEIGNGVIKGLTLELLEQPL